MTAGRIRHWKHGWIPVSPQALAFAAGRGPNPTGGDVHKLPAVELRGFDDLSPSLQGKINKKLESLTGMPEPELARRVQENLERLYRDTDKSETAWYSREGADIAARADRITRDYPGTKLTDEQLTGMIAVTSARKRWQENKDFADRVARKVAADEPFRVTQVMVDDYNAWASKRRGRSLTVPHPDLRPGTYRPSELPADFAASKTPGMPKHLNADYVISAVKIARNESTLDEAIGGPKQRSFVNNLLDPSDDRFVTVDTWHYKAAMQGIPVTRKMGDRTYTYTLDQWQDRDLAVADGRAAMHGFDPTLDRYDPKNIKATVLAADNMSPQMFFQSGPSSVAEKWHDGTYPWFVKQTQVVAQRVGASPNGLQAVAWVAVGGGV